MNKKLNMMFCVLVTLFVSGCGQIGVDPSSSNVLKSQNSEVIINNIPLNYKVSIDGYNSRFTNDLLEANVNITNRDGTQHELEYKFKWYDTTGFEVGEGLSNWTPFVLDASDTLALKSMAITPKAETFKFYIRAKQ